MAISKTTGSMPSFRTTQTDTVRAPAPQQRSLTSQTNTFARGTTQAGTTPKRTGITRDLSARRVTLPQTETAGAPQNAGLANAVAQNGLRTNQDLINHFYKQGGGNWDGAQAAARQMGVDLNDLVRDRGGAINTTDRPTLGGEAGRVAAQNGIYTNQDMINHCYKQGGGSWDGAQRIAQSMGLDLNNLVRDRQGTIRPPTGGAQPGGNAPAQPGGNAPAPAGGNAPAQPGGNQPGGVQGPGATTPPAPNTGNTGADILNAARNELALGVRENAGSNEDREGHIRKYRNSVTTLAHNRGPEAWCADFVSYAAKQAGAPLGPNGQGFASVSAMRDWMQQSGRYHTGNPQPGDIVFFNWDGGRPDHVGIVESVNADGTVNTIEGNTSGPGGQGLHRRNRSPGTIVGYGTM